MRLIEKYQQMIRACGLIAGFFLILVFVPGKTSLAQEKNEQIRVVAEDWLKAGNFTLEMPVFDTVENLEGDTFNTGDLLTFDYLDIKSLHPIEAEAFSWIGETTNWELLKSNKSNFVRAERRPDKGVNQLAYFAFYVEVKRWMEAEIKISSPQLFEAWLNGELLFSKKKTDEPDSEKTSSSDKEVKLERGKHLVVVKSLKPASNRTDWELKAEVSFPEKDYSRDDLLLTTSPKASMNIHHLLEGTFINNVSLSPSGNYRLMRFSQVRPPEGNKTSWYEVYDSQSERMVHNFKHAGISSVEWCPVGNIITYKTSEKEKSSLWMFNLDTMTEEQLLNDVEDLGGYEWAPDGSFIIYSIREESKDDDSGLKRYEGMPDRWPWWRNRSFLYLLDVKSGITKRLTHGHVTTSLQDISPDSERLLFSQSIPDFTERPYSKQVMIEMSLESMEIDTIWIKKYSANCSYSPDGEWLLVTGSPAFFGKTGINLEKDLIPNDYDTQAYLYNLSTGDVDPITFAFNPSVVKAEWSLYDENKILMIAADRTYRKLFSYDLNTRYFSGIKTGFDVVNSFSAAAMKPVVACTGSGISTPPYAAEIDLDTGVATIIANPRSETFQHVVFGETKDWNFTNEEGVEIEGRIYYPPDFDQEKTYPLIVYYYGGTSPTERSFGGRYPKNMFAAQGYVVYNLQPSGATGYGQEFSAAHVNNWGITVADEIIQGTELFVEAHDFIDREKIGCIGASYGGFMTMLLQTRTDIFAAAVSHAGISSISSYWGEGYWGYLYNSVAAAESFPWNNQDLYVEQSALFQADQINTPLLLLHGGSDTNVPIGESIQLYTALKLLGRPVELIEVEGQDHHIVDYKKRIRWQKTIFAWFDYWLKDQPEWWLNLYPERSL